MTISIKRRSGGEILHIAQAFHDSIADAYAAKYAAVPVTKRHPRTTIAVKLQAKMTRIYARSFVEQRAEIRRQYL